MDDFYRNFPRLADFANFSKNSKKIELECDSKFGGFLRAELPSNACAGEVRRSPPS